MSIWRRNSLRNGWFLWRILYELGMRLSSVSMSETRSRSSVAVECVFSMIGGVRTVSAVWALRFEKEAMDLIFLMIEDMMLTVVMMVLELVALFINRESIA